MKNAVWTSGVQVITWYLPDHLGQGKTTIARLIAKFFKKLDILLDDKLIEVDRSDLVGSYIGHTEKNTKMQSIVGRWAACSLSTKPISCR
ncbi:AAA family ATPase [Jeotgalicoccus sp. WY2]|uniref:AAA family ATPase n=1 Tax=Jeotgalicoccus sp. WY2 TaxID=2708346 RepID=UPI0035304E27